MRSNGSPSAGGPAGSFGESEREGAGNEPFEPYKHGKQVFDTVENFNLWLAKENFFFDNKSPGHFLGTISGIKFIDDS